MKSWSLPNPSCQYLQIHHLKRTKEDESSRIGCEKCPIPDSNQLQAVKDTRMGRSSWLFSDALGQACIRGSTKLASEKLGENLPISDCHFPVVLWINLYFWSVQYLFERNFCRDVVQDCISFCFIPAPWYIRWVLQSPYFLWETGNNRFLFSFNSPFIVDLYCVPPQLFYF